MNSPLFNSRLGVALLLLTSAQAALAAQTFGYRGYDGRTGVTGRNGIDGNNVTYTLTGQSVNVDLSGSRGERGDDGEDGRDASGCYPPSRPAYDLQGAEGGGAGTGGQGGHGGDGGVITSYFSDINNLKSVFVSAYGGTGGDGGYQGRPGYGCRCRESSWSITDSRGNRRTYYCRDGYDGRRAMSGARGLTGSLGYAVLIPQLTPIEKDEPQRFIKMTELLNGPYLLSRNLWIQRTGARSLFAAGSQIRDQYLYYSGRIEKTIGFRWDASRPIGDFAKSNVLINLDSNNKIGATFGDDIWWDGTEEIQSPTSSVIVVTKALYASDAVQLSLNSLAGASQSLTAVVRDATRASDLVKTHVWLRYSTRIGASPYTSRWSGDVPAEDVTWDGDNLNVHIGQLDISPGYLRSGTLTFVELVITRSLGKKSTTVSRQLYQRIQ